MTTLTWVRFLVAAAGLVVWGYGYRVDDATIRWAGIAFLAVAVLLRFWVRRPRPPA
jgi:hypothetical protein